MAHNCTLKIWLKVRLWEKEKSATPGYLPNYSVLFAERKAIS
jgi:hypothetical protein